MKIIDENDMKDKKDQFPGFLRQHISAGRQGHGRGFIQLYILHSLKREPKSGYDLIKEISERTEGVWIPSKGTLYPMLKKMDEENLIRISETGKRSKTVYELTDDGINFLENVIRHREEAEEKMYIFREMMTEIFGKNSPAFRKKLIEMWHLTDTISPENEKSAIIILEKSLKDLRRLSDNESSKS